MTRLFSTFSISAVLAALAFAQPPGPPLHEPGGFDHVLIKGALGFDGRVVTGAPYSAQAVSETTQALADGNTINRKTTAAVARDSQGRTRREETLSNIGPWSTDGQARSMVFINDPVANANYVLDASRHTANKMAVPQFRAHQKAVESSAASGDNVLHARKRLDSANIKKESLGTQTVGGVAAEGTRLTHTIPAGQIGNARPIDIVDEQWVSPDLKVVVMSKHTDPRSGTTTYTLTNIQRAEPDVSLFAVPSDYTVQQGPGGGPAGYERRR